MAFAITNVYERHHVSVFVLHKWLEVQLRRPRGKKHAPLIYDELWHGKPIPAGTLSKETWETEKNNSVGRSWSTNGQFDRDLVCNYMHLPALWKHQWSSFTIHMHLCLIKYLQDETHPCFSSIWVCHGLSKNKISSPKSSGSTSFSKNKVAILGFKSHIFRYPW